MYNEDDFRAPLPSTNIGDSENTNDIKNELTDIESIDENHYKGSTIEEEEKIVYGEDKGLDAIDINSIKETESIPLENKLDSNTELEINSEDNPDDVTTVPETINIPLPSLPPIPDKFRVSQIDNKTEEFTEEIQSQTVQEVNNPPINEGTWTFEYNEDDNTIEKGIEQSPNPIEKEICSEGTQINIPLPTEIGLTEVDKEQVEPGLQVQVAYEETPVQQVQIEEAPIWNTSRSSDDIRTRISDQSSEDDQSNHSEEPEIPLPDSPLVASSNILTTIESYYRRPIRNNDIQATSPSNRTDTSTSSSDTDTSATDQRSRSNSPFSAPSKHSPSSKRPTSFSQVLARRLASAPKPPASTENSFTNGFNNMAQADTNWGSPWVMDGPPRDVEWEEWSTVTKKLGMNSPGKAESSWDEDWDTNEASQVAVPCPLSWAGCKARIRTEERQSHQEKAASSHLSLVLQQFEAQRKQFDELGQIHAETSALVLQQQNTIKVLRDDLNRQKSSYEGEIEKLKAQLESREMELQRAVELLVHRSELAAQLGASNSLATSRS